MANSTENYASKYESQLNQAFTLASVIAGKTNTEYSFDGVRTIHIQSAVTQPLKDYKRTGTWRYGDPDELKTDLQDVTLSLDKSFSLTIDKGNYKDSALARKKGAVIKAEIGEQVTPFFDKNALTKWATAGVVLAAPTTLDKTTILDPFVDARKMFVNSNIPMTDSCFAYVKSSAYSLLLRNPEFISVEKLGEKHLVNGLVGKVMNWQIIEVPDAYLPEKTNVLFTHKSKVMAPSKIAELKTYEDVPGISGTLIEGRYYGDAFALKTLVNDTTTEGGVFSTVGIINCANA
jgi:hypothetical protein